MIRLDTTIAVLMKGRGIFFPDDLEARRYAQRRGIAISGTLGILTQLVKTGRLAVAQPFAKESGVLGLPILPAPNRSSRPSITKTWVATNALLMRSSAAIPGPLTACSLGTKK